MSGFLPVVADSFREHAGVPTAPQMAAWPGIQTGKTFLIFQARNYSRQLDFAANTPAWSVTPFRRERDLCAMSENR